MPPDASRLQFPVVTTRTDFATQPRRLRSLPPNVVAEPGTLSPTIRRSAPKPSILFWLHELARFDRHRTLRIGQGRVAEPRAGVWVPADVEGRGARMR